MIARFKAGWIGLVLLFVSGCSEDQGRITLVSTAVIIDGDQRYTQDTTVACRWAGVSDGVVRIGTTSIVEGDQHWLRRSDGSVVVFPRFRSCFQPDAPLGTSEDVTGQLDMYPAANDQIVQIFDNADKPAKVDLFAFASLERPDSPLRLESVRITRQEGEVTRGLRTEFPGLAHIMPADRDQPLYGGNLTPGYFTGLYATETILVPGTDCKTSASDGVILLPDQHFCGFVNDCERSGPTIVCGQSRGGLKISYRDNFGVATVADKDANPDYLGTLFNTRSPAFQKAPTMAWNKSRKWRPQICVGGLCAPPSKNDLALLFYFPKSRRLIEVAVVQRAYRPDGFSGWASL